MQRFFDFPAAVWAYFSEVDRRFAAGDPPAPLPAPGYQLENENLGGIRAVLWDIYGTLAGVGVGDLEAALGSPERLRQALQAMINEYDLAAPLGSLFPHQPPAPALAELFLGLIDDTRLRALAQGIEYPEIVIEDIWQSILAQLATAGYHPPYEEPRLHTAQRWAYFFDGVFQQTYLYPGAAATLNRLRQAGIVQGIISNAQFYTPIHLRRLLRQDLGEPGLEFTDIFTDSLVLFSYELGYGKPNPRGFHKAIALLNRQGITREEILYIGNDMLCDVWCSLRAGIRSAFFVGDATQTFAHADDQRCRGLRPDGIFTAPDQVPPAILNRRRSQ